VQYYYFGVPKEWDPTKAYPLFFELHGAGDDHPLGGPASRLGLTAQAVMLHGYDTPRVYAEIDRSGYWVHPFCRGNLGYAGIARIDVLETYDHVHNLVSIDADRRYLYGFSMGSMGTLTLSQLTPSRWAAFGAMSGAGSLGAPVRTYLLDNLNGLPFKMMIGGEDGGAKNFLAMAEAMRARGLNPELTVIDNLGHNYTQAMQQEMITWLKTKTRQRPARFTFTTVDNLTSDCWGVRLAIDYGVPLRGGGGPRRELRVVDETAQPFARATVAIAGQTVTIDSVGAQRLALDFSKPDGLGLEGEVRVLWNGKEVYAGTARSLNLE
jgi:pimeloyl-ACP methyl ester carboxylesterase